LCVSRAVFISSSHLSQHVTELIISCSMVHSATILLFIFCYEGSVFEVEVMSHCIHILLSISGILFLETLCVEQSPDEPLAVQNVPECTDWSKVNVYNISKVSRPAWRPTRPLIWWVPGFFPRVKWLECEADHWTPFNAELGMIGYILLLSYTPSWCRLQKFLWCLNSYIPQLKHPVRLRFKSLSWVQGMWQKTRDM